MTTVNLLDHILGHIEGVRTRCPELRFGQLMATIGMLAEDETGHSLWDIEDTDFAAALERFAADMARREASDNEPDPALDRGSMAPAPISNAPQPPGQVS